MTPENGVHGIGKFEILEEMPTRFHPLKSKSSSKNIYVFKGDSLGDLNKGYRLGTYDNAEHLHLFDPDETPPTKSYCGLNLQYECDDDVFKVMGICFQCLVNSGLIKLSEDWVVR